MFHGGGGEPQGEETYNSSIRQSLLQKCSLFQKLLERLGQSKFKEMYCDVEDHVVLHLPYKF